MNKLVKDALILTAITLVAGLALGFVFELTLPARNAAAEAATQAAYRAVFADADSFTVLDGFDAAAAKTAAGGVDDVNNCVVACDASGNALGYVITMTSHAGYGGDITFSVGITNDGVINGYSITDISETAGLGMKAKEAGFSSQFDGVSASNEYVVTKTGATAENEINAISGATITSRAMTNAINSAIKYYSTIAQ